MPPPYTKLLLIRLLTTANTNAVPKINITAMFMHKPLTINRI